MLTGMGIAASLLVGIAAFYGMIWAIVHACIRWEWVAPTLWLMIVFSLVVGAGGVLGAAAGL